MTNLNVHTDILILGTGVNAMVCVAFCQHYNLSFKVLALTAGLHSRNRHFTITPTTEKIFKKLCLQKCVYPYTRVCMYVCVCVYIYIY